jgi:hypothetical protein
MMPRAMFCLGFQGHSQPRGFCDTTRQRKVADAGPLGNHCRAGSQRMSASGNRPGEKLPITRVFFFSFSSSPGERSTTNPQHTHANCNKQHQRQQIWY